MREHEERSGERDDVEPRDERVDDLEPEQEDAAEVTGGAIKVRDTGGHE